MTQSSITLIASCFDISGMNMRKTWWGGSLYLPALYIRPHRIRTIVYTAACRGKHICVICSPSMCADYMCWVSCGLDRRKVYHCWHWFCAAKAVCVVMLDLSRFLSPYIAVVAKWEDVWRWRIVCAALAARQPISSFFLWWAVAVRFIVIELE